MIFNNRSNYMLKYEKSKSKLVEFAVAKENYPKYQLNPDDLTYTTMYALSRFCEEMIENPQSSQISELKDDLAIVSQYYDSTVKTQLRSKYSKWFLLLGSTAYFLSENFGSAKVLISQIENWYLKEDIATLLFITLNFLLTGKWVEVPTETKYYLDYLNGLRNHFEEGASYETIFSTLNKMRSSVYQSDDVLDVSCIDFLYTVAICAIEYSAWILLPQYSKWSLEHWKSYFSKPNSVKLLWPAQKVILQADVLQGKNLIVPLPTGVGKTKSIEILLRDKFMKHGSCIAVIIAPLRALCNEITLDLSSAFRNEAIINQFTDTMQEDFNLDVLFNTKYVFICTPEKFSYILRHEPDFLAAIQLFIFDEAHLFDDVSRGTQYELLVSEITRNRNDTAQMVLFSAVLSNANQISKWLFGDETSIIDNTLVKSTEKSIGFISSDQTIHYYDKENMEEESFYVPKSIDFTWLQLHGREKKQRVFPEKTAQDIAIYYGNKLCCQGAVAIYAGQVRSIPSIMRRIVEIHNRGYDLSNLYKNGDINEILRIAYLFELHYGEEFELTQAAKLGAFSHYADLSNGIKMAVEHALRKRYISFVVCTTTLAEGVNIPIKYLFLTTFSFGTSSVQIRKMQNMVGRTARSGIHTEGSAIITDSNFYDKRLEWKGGGKYRWADCKKMFDYGNTEACTSAILSLVSNLSIDYEYYYKASAIISYWIENYDKRYCFSRLVDIIQESYKNNISDDKRYLHYSLEIESKVMQLKHIVENIENYLCYIYNSYQDDNQFISIVDNLVIDSFAYFLGDSVQKEALRNIFQLIAQKIVSDVETDKTIYYAKSLYGIEISKQVLKWLDDNIDNLCFYSLEQLLNEIVNLFLQLFPDKVKVTFDILNDVLHLWINGASYIEIFKSFQKEISINQIEKICSSTFSYHLCFLIGNILDAIGDREEELVERLVLLQKRVKYGVSSGLQILISESLFDDRIVVNELENLIGQIPLTEKELKSHMVMKQNEILNMLKPYPEYFSYKFRLYLK